MRKEVVNAEIHKEIQENNNFTFMNVTPYQKNAGFTLIEILVTMIIVGVLAAIAAPNFFSLLKQNEVKEGIAILEHALKDAQRIAIRESKKCTVTIDAGTNNLTAAPTECLPTTRNISTDLDMAINTNLSPSGTGTATDIDVSFSYKGNIDVEDVGGTTIASTIIISSDGTDTVKCLYVAEGIGLMKVGDYTSNSCVPAD